MSTVHIKPSKQRLSKFVVQANISLYTAIENSTILNCNYHNRDTFREGAGGEGGAK